MRKHVLCIDDNEDTCSMLSVLLGLADYHVATAGTLAEGLNLARNQRFDLYLLDFRLPDGNGLQLCQAIRSFDQCTPIIFCSGRSNPQDRQEAMSAGAQAYLIKPIDPDVLKETIQWLLAKANYAAGRAGRTI
jgi:DNA-binding response OmpR family regulator